MIHTPYNGQPDRRVFVDDRYVEAVFFADTDKGFVRYFLQPMRANPRRSGARWAKRRGRVVVYTRTDPVEEKRLIYAPTYFEWAAMRGKGN